MVKVMSEEVTNAVSQLKGLLNKYPDKKLEILQYVFGKDTIMKIINRPTYEELEQENQQLKETIKRCYTPEEIDFEIMVVKAELEAEKDINNNLHKTIDKLRVNLYETQQERDLYKEFVEKVREYIKHEWFKRGQLGIIDKSFQEWQLKDILQILDKVGDKMINLTI